MDKYRIVSRETSKEVFVVQKKAFWGWVDIYNGGNGVANWAREFTTLDEAKIELEIWKKDASPYERVVYEEGS